VAALDWAGRRIRADGTRYRRSGTVPDLVFVLSTIALFVVLALAVTGVERL